ncbi:MAG: hypothetical protein EOP04_09315 [Proteobacteria bacterium]|nr:MAG: hypothetical protein EOP04_09315 [Pseudomonadota bacterium]
MFEKVTPTGAEIRYENSDFGMQFAIDNGVSDSNLFSLADKGQLFQVEVFDYLIQNEDGLMPDNWSKKVILFRILYSTEKVSLLEANYSTIVKWIGVANFHRNLVQIQAAQDRRTKLRFPRV